MKKSHGFTLIEIMITLAIIGILVSIAVPSVTSYKQKGLLGGAKSFMMTVASKQQEYMLTNRQYAIDDDPGTTGLEKLNITLANEKDIDTHFSVTITGPADRSRFVLTLTPKVNGSLNGYQMNGVALGNVNPLTINSAGHKTPNAFW